MATENEVQNLTRQLYPTGRAWYMPRGGTFDKITKGLIKSEVRAYNDALSVLDSILPDNDNFDLEDAQQWERRLGLITNLDVPLADRKAAILRKMNHPGDIPARQNYLYIQNQLRLAGFDVYVYENIFADGMGGFETKTPVEFSLTTYPTADIQYQSGIQYGDVQYGGNYGNKVVNYIEESLDDPFNVGSDLRSTFFIGGNPAGSYASVSADRKNEFRQLILKLKPTYAVAFLLVNFV